MPPRLRFAVIGINHGHIDALVAAVQAGGGAFVAFHAREPELVAAFSARHPGARFVDDERRILEDASIQLVLSAGIPNERAPLGIRVMQHGKDFLSDKPGITSLEQLASVRQVQGETRRIHAILYSERLESAATLRAAELVRAGAIGQVLQTIGLGPHRVHPPVRPDWFWDRERFGGILCDIGSHQVDQFLCFTQSTAAEVVASQAGNMRHPDRPGFEDFGDATLRGNGGLGYFRVDWFTPAGLPTWGDGRLTVLGSDGYIEVRKYVDIARRDTGNHLFLVDGKGTHYMDCSGGELPYGRQLVDDVLHRTETAMTQAHCFLVAELALRAQQVARGVAPLAPNPG